MLQSIKTISLVISPLLLFANGCVEKQTELVLDRIEEHPVDASIRALEVVSDSTIWFAGSKGKVGVSHDGGDSWNINTIKQDSLDLEFRSIAVTRNGAFVLSVDSPGLLFRTQDDGSSWQLVYRENHPSTFYDSLAFWDDDEGIAMGDPTDNCLSVIITRDGGEHWEKLSCNKLPPVIEGEAAFAASNSNIALVGDNAWLVTGGMRARVFHSPDRGKTWAVFNTPIAQGGQMTGIFSTDFFNEQVGILFGGDWNKKEVNSANKAITYDGGRTWQLLADGQGPGYRSSVRFMPGSNGQGIFAVGDKGISYSVDGGNTWSELSQENFYTLRISPTGKSVWVAGSNRVAKLVFK